MPSKTHAASAAVPRGATPIDTTPRLTIERTTIILLFLMLLALAFRIQADSDMWWHLRSGQWMVENQQLITVDTFSHTFAGTSRTHYEWLSQIILYGIWSLSGQFGMALFTAVMATAGMAVLFRASEGSTYMRAFVIVLCAATAAVFWSARPQMFSFLFSTVVVYLVLYLYKRCGIDRLWWLVPLMWLWAQLHVGWSIGFIILGAVIAGEGLNRLLGTRLGLQPDHTLTWPQIMRLVVVSLISAAVMLINPYGFALLRVPLETVSIGPLTAFIQEWLPPDLARPEIWPFVLLMVLTALVVVVRWRRLDFAEVLLLAASGFLALRAGRNIAFFAVVAAPILTYHLHAIMQQRGWVLKTVQRPTRRMVLINRLLIILVAFAALMKIAYVALPTTANEATATIMPVEAVAWLNENQPPGPMFNSYNIGGYLAFFAPQYPVYIDGRTDLYRDFVLDYVQTMRADEGWREDLDGINLVIIEPGTPLAAALRAEIGWSPAYEDNMAVVFTRE
jgi:hypothetical protein